MVVALFTLTAGLERARRQRKGASTLSLLQVVAEHREIRPKEIAGQLQVHPSLVTRQVREVEAAGLVRVEEDPADRRSWLVTLTPAGLEEMSRLQEFGLERFALFTADWEPGDVRQFAALLEKLKNSIDTVAERERRMVVPRRARQRDRLMDRQVKQRRA
jgi:DNA-binding MarR family transcriptional regulator